MFEPWNLFLSLIFGTIGFAYFRYGKKQGRPVALACGVVMMIYPYFITNAMLLAAIGILLMLLPKFIG